MDGTELDLGREGSWGFEWEDALDGKGEGMDGGIDGE